MKKVYLLVVAIFSFAAVSSQEHATFRGHELNGSLESFAKALEGDGYILSNASDENCFLMSGSFVGYDECIIAIAATPKTHIVSNVSVYLPQQTDWYNIKKEYERIKDLFTKKYGEPKSHYNFFSNPYCEGDGLEESAVRNKKVYYLSVWEIPNGRALVEISDLMRVHIAYEDNANVILKAQEKESNILEEI